MSFIRDRKCIFTATFLAMAVFILGTVSISASAKNDYPVGGIWELEHIERELITVGTEDESTENSSGLLRGSALFPLDTAQIDTGAHYECLSDEEKILYEAIYTLVSTKKYIPYSARGTISNDAIRSNYAYIIYTGTGYFSEAYNITSMSNSLNRAQEAIYFDHPGNVEFYMCKADYGNISYSDGTYGTYIVATAYYDDTQFASIDSQIQTSLNTIVSDIRSKNLVNASWPALTELNVHDYFSKLVSYDKECSRNSGESGYFHLAHTAYGALCNKKAVCDGYSTGYQMILEKLGVDAMVIAGAARSSGGSIGGHAWNIVRLDGYWYEVDTTWASPSGNEEVDHDYFNKTTAEYKSGINNKKHERLENYGFVGFRMPVATGTHYTYAYLTQTEENGLANDSTYVAVQEITLSSTSMEVEVGQSFIIEPSFTPNNATVKDYSVSSSNTDVVQVIGQTLYANAVGKAAITVTATDGGNSKTCEVTVKQTQNEQNNSDIDNENSSNSGNGQTGGNEQGGNGDQTGGNDQSGGNDQTGGNDQNDGEGQNGGSDQNGREDQSGGNDQNGGEGQSGGDSQSGGNGQSDSTSGNAGQNGNEADKTPSRNSGDELSYDQGSGKGTYIVNEDRTSVTFKTSGKSKAASLNIPSVITDESGNTYTVTEISANLKKNNKKLKKLIIPETITKIGKRAFADCPKLKNVKIYAKSLKSIESGAFRNLKKGCKITIVAQNKKQYKKIVKMLKKAGAKNATFKYKKG